MNAFLRQPADPVSRAAALLEQPEFPALFEAFLADVLRWNDGLASDEAMDNALYSLLVTLAEMVDDPSEVKQ